MHEARSEELRLENVSRRFGNVLALDRTDLFVPAGELIALLGPSGCGKTTTLRIIAGLEALDTGRVLLGSRDLALLPSNKRRLGMVFQDYSLFPHMTVVENVGFGLRIAKVPKEEIQTRVSEILDLVRLTGLDDRYPNQLSGGQQQRTALARSLVTNPSVLLLDEPLGALDKNLRERMQFELRQLQRGLGITTVMVTHDQEEALTLSDRIAVMNEGRVLQVGSPREIYDRPRTRFVSEFLGAANIFKGMVSELRPDGCLVMAVPETGGAPLPIRVATPARQSSEQKVTLAVRPERMSITSNARSDGNVAQAEVLSHIFRGTHHSYQVRLAGSPAPLLVYEQVQGKGTARVFDNGEAVYLHWDPTDTILLQEEAAR